MKTLGSIIFTCVFFLNCNKVQETQSISTIELKALLQKQTIQLIDVRTPKEIELGFIETAKFANYFDADFSKQISKLADKNKTLYLYCRSGNRSGKASKILKKEGYKVVNVLGGYNQWKSENKK